MKRWSLLLPFLLLAGCAGIPFRNPLVTFTFGPLMTLNIGEKNDTREINAYGRDVAHEAIASTTEAIHIEIPSRGEERKDNAVQQQPDKHYKNLW